MFVAGLVNVSVAVGISDGVNVAVEVGVRVFDCVGVAVRVNVLVGVALGVRVGSSFAEFVTTGSETIDTRVFVGSGSRLLHAANIKELKSMNRKTTRRIEFLLENHMEHVGRAKRNRGSEIARAWFFKIVGRAREKISLSATNEIAERCIRFAMSETAWGKCFAFVFVDYT